MTRTLQRAFAVLGARRGRLLWAVAIMAAVVVALGAVRLVATNVDAWAARWRGGAAMVVYLGEGTGEARAQAITAELAALPGVVRAEYVAPAEATRRLRAALGRSEALLDGVDAEALPATVEVVLEPGARDVVAASPLLAALRGSDAVDDVDLGGEWVDQLAAAIGAAKEVGWSLAFLLALAAALAVAGAVRLALAEDPAEASERHVARLLGASRAYFVTPTALAGALLGALGALVGAGILALLIHRHGAALAAPMTRAFGADALVVPTAREWALLVGLGAGLGLLGGLLAGARRAAS